MPVAGRDVDSRSTSAPDPCLTGVSRADACRAAFNSSAKDTLAAWDKTLPRDPVLDNVGDQMDRSAAARARLQQTRGNTPFHYVNAAPPVT